MEVVPITATYFTPATKAAVTIIILMEIRPMSTNPIAQAATSALAGISSPKQEHEKLPV